MNKLSIFLISLLVIILSAALIIQGYHGKGSLISPQAKESKVLGLNQWFPQQDFTLQNAPQVTSKAAFFIETESGEVLYAKNIHQKLPIASLVKVMTALIALEHRELDEKLWVSEKAASMEPDKMLLIPGETLTLKELLYGIFLISANDAAEVLAETSTGERAQFIKLMNEKAKQLGMKNTLFVNPTGLDEDSGSSYSTAYDLAILTRYAIREFPSLIEISQTPHILIDKTKDHQDYDMYSGINLLTTYPGVVGFKTGFTPEAGLTLITLAKKDGNEVLGVLLATERRREEAQTLLDLSFSKLDIDKTALR